MEELRLLDNLQILLWSITYLEILYWGIKHCKEHLLLMPFAANILNFAWEINAIMISRGFWGHVIWLALDVAIVILNTYHFRKRRNRLLYWLLIIGSAIILRFIFMLPRCDGMLISVFAIDLIMAVDFVANAKKISPHGKIPIAITKLFGDLFAWLAYSHLALVNVIGVLVFLLNLYYLSLCLEMRAQAVKQKKGRK